jgi:hypothetical protein
MLSLSDSCGRTASWSARPDEMAEGLVFVRSFCGARARVTAPSSTACLWPAAVEGFGFASCEDSALCLDVLRCLGGNAAETGDMRLTLGLPARTGDLGREWCTAPLAEGGPASGSASGDSVLDPSEIAVTSRKLQRCESVAGFRSGSVLIAVGGRARCCGRQLQW